MRGSKIVLLAGSVSLTLSLLAGTEAASVVTSAAASVPPAGTLVTKVPVTATGVNGTAYVVEYSSEAYPSNALVRVTGLVVVPPGTPPVGGWPVVSWAHGTDGTNGKDSPSNNPATDVPEINSMLAQGWEVVATDYLGEGNINAHLKPKPTKGPLPYLVGASAARNALDIVKAVQGSTTFNASSSYAVWGHSEGGQTAMFALNIASTYAPGLDLVGVLALAPPSNFPTLLPAIEATASWPFLFLAVGGYQAAYGKTAANVKLVLTKKTGTKDLKLLKTASFGITAVTVYSQGFSTVFTLTNGGPLPASWQTLVDQNDAANFTSPSDAPLVIVSGDQDPLVIPSTTNMLANELCALTPVPQDLERWLYTGLDHGGIVGSDTIGDYVQWTANRFADDAAHDYTPTGSIAHPATVTQSCG
jgi:pimeloyl-ACP methyl ester carboxylesterase